MKNIKFEEFTMKMRQRLWRGVGEIYDIHNKYILEFSLIKR